MLKKVIALWFFSLMVVGCGQSSDDFSTDSTPYTIAVLAPLNSGQTEFGLGIRNSVQLAVDQWNEAHQLTGPLFELAAFDDSSDPEIGKEAARKILELPRLVGVVGTYNSGVASAVLPMFSSAGVPVISPGNTDPALTLGADLQAPVRPYKNYFRLVVPDHLQGTALADYAWTDRGWTQAAILSESKSVSQALANAFSKRFTQLGGAVLKHEIATSGTTDYQSYLTDIAATTPPFLFYAGEVPNASTVRTQASGLGLNVPMMGGDGMKATSYIEESTVSTEGDIASSLGVPASLLPSANEFLQAYSDSGFSAPPSDFGPYSYDAAQLFMEAVAGTEEADTQMIIEYLGQIDTEGVTGRLSFDQFGDTLNRRLTINTVQGGKFVSQKTVDVSL